MKTKNILIGALTAGMFLATVGNAFSQREDPRRRGASDGGTAIQQQLKTLKPGQWIDITGVPQKNGVIDAVKLKKLTGDFEPSDCEVRGTVRRLNLEKEEFYIMGMLCTVTEETEYEQSGQGPVKFAKFADMRTDILIEAEGVFKDGKFIAEEVQDESATEDEEEKTEVAVTGQIQSVDVERKMVKIMNMEFKISGTTKIKKGF